MKIIKIEIPFQGYDTYDVHIIACDDSEEAIRLAQLKANDYGMGIWSQAKMEVLGEYTGKEKKPFIILSSFNAG